MKVDDVVGHYSIESTPLDTDDVKLLFNMMLYGGTLNGWMKEITTDKIDKGYVGKTLKQPTTQLLIVNQFEKECQLMSKMVNSENPSMVRKLKKPEDAPIDTKNRVISYFFQIIENHILYVAYKYFVGKKIITSRVCALEYDGLCFPPNGTEYDKDLTVAELNNHIFNITGLNIKFKFKGYGTRIRQDLIDIRGSFVVADAIIEVDPASVIEINTVAETSSAVFNRLVVPFEKVHTKIINDSVFVKETDDKVILMSKRDLIISYEHIQCGLSSTGVPVCFINKWTTYNDKINCKDSMEIYPNSSHCPKNVFNLWRPFAMELLKSPYNNHIEGLNVMLKHIRILCNNDEIIYKYFLGWIAMMIQQPEKKITCITLISDEGAGKGSLMQLFSKMLGSNKVFETKDPARDVWGNFNSLMIDAFLVNLNELEYKETMESEGKIKALITDSKMSINQKGLPQFKITSHHHFIITTNKENPIKTQKGDRRKLIIRSSDELIGNRTYFDKMYKLLDNEEVIRTCYDFFKKYDITNYDFQSIPETEYQNNLKEIAQSPVEEWLSYFIYENRNKEIMPPMDGDDIYDEFRRWCILKNRKFDTDAKRLGMKLTNLRIKGIENGSRVNNSRTKIFNITELKLHFGIKVECLITL